MVMPINGFMRTPPSVLKLSTDVLQRASIRKVGRYPDRLLIPLQTARSCACSWIHDSLEYGFL
jgi:hypothetical protein